MATRIIFALALLCLALLAFVGGRSPEAVVRAAQEVAGALETLGAGRAASELSSRLEAGHPELVRRPLWAALILAGLGLVWMRVRTWRLENRIARLLDGEEVDSEPTLLMTAGDLFYRHDLDGRLQFLDERGRRMLGYDEDEVAGLELARIMDAFSLLRVRARIEARVAGDPLDEPSELLLFAKDGRPLWIESRGRLVTLEGRPVAIEGVARDITREKVSTTTATIQMGVASALGEASSLEGALRGVLQVFCEQLESEYAEFWWADEALDVLRCAAAWHAGDLELERCADAARGRTCGRGAGLLGRVWSQGKVIRLQDPAEAKEAGREDLAEASLQSVLTIPVRLLGSVVGAVVVAGRTPGHGDWLPLEALEALGGQLGQLSERRRMQDALRASEARKHAVVESALDCVIIVDHEDRVIEWNPAAARTFGRLRTDALGQPLASLIVPEELRARHVMAFRACVESGEQPFGGNRTELEAMRADGSRVPVEVAISRIDTGGDPIFTSYLRDITDRREVEKLKDELVSTVSHELRTPLASLRGFVELMLMRDYPKEDRTRFLTIIDEEIRRLTKLIDEFLDVQRLEAGMAAHEVREGDLVPLVREAVEVIRPSSDRHRFEVQALDGPLVVRMEPDRIKQALLNLLSNAAKYSPEGGTVQVRCMRSGDAACIRVRDEGVGMDSATLEKLFTKFFRADASVTRSVGGTGLGLALVKQIAEAHGGAVRAESEVGRGSEFTLELPLA